jgi:hypothetical protein
MAGYLFPGCGPPSGEKINVVGNYFCRKRDINDPRGKYLFEVKAGESLLLWPNRRHVGVEDFRQTSNSTGCILKWKTHAASPLAIEQHCSVRDAQYVISLFRQFLSEQEKLQRSIALEIFCC